MKGFKYLLENVWVWAGTGLVLITLSGGTRTSALLITIIAVLVHLILSSMKGSDE